MSKKPQNIEFTELNESESSEESTPILDGNVDLIGHIDVQLTAQIGHIDITVDELFTLEKGNVLTMVEKVDEPLTLLINDKPVAKASLVAVGDHFGVQIVDIVK